MELNPIKTGAGCAFNLNYHLVWCPKRRKAVLVGQIAEDAKSLFRQIGEKIGAKVESIEVLPDQVRIFVSADPKLSPHKIVKRFKGATSNFLRKKYPQLLKLPTLWSSFYYVGSVGHVSESVVKLYIEGQKGK